MDDPLGSASGRLAPVTCSPTHLLTTPVPEHTKVGIIGLGTVGSGVARLLLEHADRATRHAGRRLWLEQVVVQDVEKPRGVTLPEGILSTDLRRITENKEIVAVAHLVGGLEPARTILLDVLKSGKDVVTANKALLAEHGPELFDCARKMGRSIAFEAAVAGGIPIIANISQCLSANQILSIHGILNGTCNFILTQMEETGADYASVLAEAQRRGYAEADPTLDVDGTDTVQKLAILAHLAFGAAIAWRDIPRCGIDRLEHRRSAVCSTSWAIGSSCWRSPNSKQPDWSCMRRRPWSRSAHRWPRSAGRSTRSTSWATPSGRCSFTA